MKLNDILALSRVQESVCWFSLKRIGEKHLFIMPVSQRRKSWRSKVWMRRRINRFSFQEAVEDLIDSTSLTKRDSVFRSITGRREDKRVKVKKNFTYSKGRLSVATSGGSKIIYSRLSRGGTESLENLFQITTAALYSIPSLPTATTIETHCCWRLQWLMGVRLIS